MKILNKLASIEYIKNKGLNRFPEKLFYENEEDKVLKFLNGYPAKYYAIRDKGLVKGNFKLSVLAKDVLKEIKGYKIFTINVSSFNYAEKQLLVGEIEILSDNQVYATLSVNPEASVRTALEEPDFNVKTTLFDKRVLNKIPYFDVIYGYIVDNGLKDMIVEFALFNCDVGIKSEKIIVYEVRTDY